MNQQSGTLSGRLKLIIILSIFIPVLVGILIFMPEKAGFSGDWVYLLPHLNAIINSITSVLLIMGLFFIRKNNVTLHRRTMMAAFIMGAIFLVSYVIYHGSAESTVFGDLNGNGTLDPVEARQFSGWRETYLGILLSHILLAVVVVPLVLLTLYYALEKKFDRHKKIVKWAYPIWLYVSITGVVVYFLIRPFY